MPDIVRAVSHAVRALVRMRTAGAIAVAILALGIGATTTMGSVAYATLFRPVPFPDAGRLVVLYDTVETTRQGAVRRRWSFPNVTTIRAAATSFEAIASFSSTSVAVRQTGPSDQIDGEVVSPEYFRILGATPSAGRAFTADDAGEPVTMISEGLWQTLSGGDRAAVGSTVLVADQPLTVVGLVPDKFRGMSGKGKLWLPTWMAPRLTYGEYLTSPQHFISVVARLGSGVSIADANAELAVLSARLAGHESRPDERAGVVALTATEARVDPRTRQTVWLLVSAAALLLLIACVNVTAVLVGRARERRRELAIRLAIGASRRRLVGQFIAEGLVLAGTAGALGSLLAAWGVRVIGAGSTTMAASWQNDYAAISPFANPSADAWLALFAFVATCATAVVASVAPAIDGSRTPLAALNAQSRGATGATRGLSRLVVVEVGLAVMLLSGAGMLTERLMAMQSFRSGFTSDNILTFSLRPPVSRYLPETGPQTIERFLTALEGVPGVGLAAVNRCTPYLGCSRSSLRFTDRPNDPEHPIGIGRHYISAAYFRTLGVPLRAGRELTTADRAGAAPVAVINETAARRFWPDGNAIGQHVRFGSTTGFTDPARPVQIVGIVGDVKYEGADGPVNADFYTSYLQFAYPDTMVMVKPAAGVDAGALAPALRAAIARVDPAVPLYDVLTLDERVSRAMGHPRFNASLLALFAGAAVLLAALGVYGVLSFTVSSRLREIGVRLAVGATPRRVMTRFVGDGMRMALAGAVGGVAGAVLVGRIAHDVVADLGDANPYVFVGVALVMLIVAAAAALVPARRASAVDPIVVLRND